MWRVAVALSVLLAAAADARHLRRDAEEADASPIRLEPDSVVVRQGHKLMIPCVFQSADITDMADLKWLTANNKPIDGESSSSVFTIGLHEHGTNYKKKTLHFMEVNRRDDGDYFCQATDSHGKVFRKKVHVSVLDPIEWTSSETRAGGLLGEPLTIDCGAKGKPEPQIQITDKEGEPLDDQLFTIAGTEVTVSYLSKEYNGLVVECMALQVLPDLGTTSTEERSVTIDVWYAPEFEHPRIDRHTVLQRTAILPCNVTASNPPARHFNFFRNNLLLNSQEKYEQVMDVLENSAYLKVKDVNEGDLGEYHCEVNNGKAKATQIINLKQANPPDEVKVTLEVVKKHGLVWSIHTDEEDELPATRVEIQYIRKELLEKELEDPSDKEATESVWSSLSSKTIRAIDDSDRYEIGGLRANTDYTFRFRAESEAGFGPTFEASASTNEEALKAKDDDVDAATTSISFLPLLLVLTLSFLSRFAQY